VSLRLGLRTAPEIVRRAFERASSSFAHFSVSRAVTWLEPTLHVELTYSEIMEGRLRDPVCRSLFGSWRFDAHRGLSSEVP